MASSFLESPEYERARGALAQYRRVRAALTELGIIRSERTVQSDYGEWLAAKLLKLTLATSGVQAGYDATDREGRTYQIKTRLVADLDGATSFDMRNPAHTFDFLLGVFLSLDCELLAIIRVSAAEVTGRARQNRDSRRLRWTGNCWHVPWVEVLYRARAT